MWAALAQHSGHFKVLNVSTWQQCGHLKVLNESTWQHCGHLKVLNVSTWQHCGHFKVLNVSTWQHSGHLKVLFSFESMPLSFLLFSQSYIFHSGATVQREHGRPVSEVSRSHTVTHHHRYDSSDRGIGPSQRPLPENTQHSQKTDTHAPGGIRNQQFQQAISCTPSLRALGQWGWPIALYDFRVIYY
jgi:hypothetical protein